MTPVECRIAAAYDCDMYKRGQKVIYQGKTYYIVDGPMMGTEGSIYHISEVPPPTRVLEHEITAA